MKKLILTLCLAATGTFAAVAQMRLTLDQALDLALSENPTVKVAEMEVQRYDYVKRQTWGGLLPQVSVTGQVNHSFIVQQMSKGFSLGNDPYTTLSGAVDASVPLFAPQVYRMMKMNDKQMATAVEAARSSRITLTAEVKKAFYNILLAEQSLDVLRESEATVQRTVDDTQVQYQNGLTSEYDLLTAQVQLSNLKPSILQTENSIRIAKLMLKMYLSIPEQVEIEVEGELDAMRDKVLAGTEGLTTDTSDNSDLRTLELQEDLLRLQRTYARQQVDVQVRSALNDLLTARETMYAQELTVEQARKAYSISDTRYRAGAGTILELNSAQLAQTQAQLNYSQAIFDYLTAKAEYDRIVGKEK